MIMTAQTMKQEHNTIEWRDTILDSVRNVKCPLPAVCGRVLAEEVTRGDTKP